MGPELGLAGLAGADATLRPTRAGAANKNRHAEAKIGAHRHAPAFQRATFVVCDPGLVLAVVQRLRSPRWERPAHADHAAAFSRTPSRPIKAEVGDLILVLSKSERLRRYCFFLAALCLCLTEVGAAGWAQGFIDETRIGMLEPIDGPPGDKYGAPNVNVEVLFERFGPEYQSSVLNYFLRPRLDIGTSISTDGDTSEITLGLTWDVFLTRRLFLEGSAGPRFTRADDRDFGCTANFRESGSVGIMLLERWECSPPWTTCPMPISAMKIAGLPRSESASDVSGKALTHSDGKPLGWGYLSKTSIYA